MNDNDENANKKRKKKKNTKKKKNSEDKDNDIITTEIKESGARNRAAQLKLAVTVNNLNLVSQNNQGLVQNLLQAAQGPGSAPGIFGLMGY